LGRGIRRCRLEPPARPARPPSVAVMVGDLAATTGARMRGPGCTPFHAAEKQRGAAPQGQPCCHLRRSGSSPNPSPVRSRPPAQEPKLQPRGEAAARVTPEDTHARARTRTLTLSARKYMLNSSLRGSYSSSSRHRAYQGRERRATRQVNAARQRARARFASRIAELWNGAPRGFGNTCTSGRP
jgi:hypothetical protein